LSHNLDSLEVTPKEEDKRGQVRRSRWPGDGPTLPTRYQPSDHKLLRPGYFS